MAVFKGKPTQVNKRSRHDRKAGTKAKYRKGSATWCHSRGMKAHGEGASRDRHKGK